MFYDMLNQILQNGTDYNEDNLPMTYGRESFRANDFYNKLAVWEIKWGKSKKVFKQSEKLDELIVVNELVEKYKNQIE